VHPWIFEACNDDNGINVATYDALNTRITMDGLMNILEMKHVRASWNHAEMLNMDERQEQAKRLAAMGGHR
jgi:hypothetical protein